MARRGIACIIRAISLKILCVCINGLAIRDGYLKSPLQTLGEFHKVENYKNSSVAGNWNVHSIFIFYHACVE